MILVGFEIGTGRRIEIPAEGHLAWFGQTQLSGKTTALEAIVFRGHLKAIAFITKQGEGSFLTGKRIQPYFSEPTNDEEQPLWRWVKSILEASQQRRLNFEESWIIRACQDPKLSMSLADVHSNIKALLAGERAMRYTGKRRGAKTREVWVRKPVTGMNAGVYTSLKAYFDIVMPQLARLPYTKKLELGPGLNVMDLREYAMETQALVIRSVMEWVYQHEKNVRVIVPESQDFVPQGKNSPVKMACETLVRKAGANKNFMWLDSQDMAAVDKVMLRACSIVGCGVQREMHEIDRTLASMFSPSLKPLDVAKLKLGEFFVCTPGANVSKVYVMPAWCDSEVHAQMVAEGKMSVETLRPMLQQFSKTHKPQPPQLLQTQIQEPPDEQKNSQDDSRIRSGIQTHTTPIVGAGRSTGLSAGTDSEAEASGDGPSPAPANDHGPARAGGIEPNDDKPTIGASARENLPESAAGDRQLHARGNEHHSSHHSGGVGPNAGDESMWKEKYETLESEHQILIGAHDALAGRVTLLEDLLYKAVGEIPPRNAALRSSGQASHSPLVTSHLPTNGNALSIEQIYQEVKTRAQNDPGILELLRHRPELHVKVERPVVSLHGNQVDGRIASLIADHFLDTPKDRAAIGGELIRRGALKRGTNLKILSPALAKLSNLGFLTVEASGYQAVAGMKIEIREQ